jgi:putative transposase
MKDRRLLIENDSGDFSIRHQCNLLGVCRGGLYYTPGTETEDNLNIMRFLDAQYLKTPFYGERRLLSILRQDGCYIINVKRLRRLMRIVRWRTLYPERRTTIADRRALKYPYLLKDLKVERCNQVWAVDITYIPMKRGFMYLFAIIDLYSLYVVGWSLSNTMTAEWCASTLEEAICRHGKPDIVNSDQGSQFTADCYIDLLKSDEIQISMDGRGRALDNVFIERLWRSVKQEYVYLNPFDTGQELWRGLDDYFQFYNRERPHQSLSNLPPQAWYHPFVKAG